MAYLLDTNVLIHLRDGDPSVTQKVVGLDDAILMSILSRVELEGGVHATTADASRKRAQLEVLLQSIPTVAFGDLDAEAYGGIVASAGYSRRKAFDRMIAAQALVQNATLVTLNAADFNDVPGLRVLAW